MSKFHSCARYVSDKIIEKILSLDTRKNDKECVYATFFQDRQIYATLSYLSLYCNLKPLKLNSEDVVFDVGSGEGRILFLVSLSPVKRCVGIECVPELVQKAQKNAEKMRFRKAPIEFHCMDAINAEYSDGTVYIFGNYKSFGTKNRLV